jgi:hypothetical protein
MYKAQNRGFDLKNRACTTLMAVLLSLLIMGCPTGGGSDPVIPGPIIIPSTSNPVPTVTDVTVTGAPSVTKSGSDVTETYNAAVTGANSPSQVVTWSIDGNPTGVSISAGGVLTVQPTAATGNITIKATSTVAGYTNKYGTVVVMINPSLPPPPPSDTDFKTETNANLLGLYPVGDYTNGAAVISAMDARADAAIITDLIDSNIFYNPTTAGNSFSHGNWPGGAPNTCGLILGNAPRMRWIVNGNNLVYYGESTTTGITITFNVAVIRISDGYGWIYGPDTDYDTDPDLTGVVKETYNYESDVRTISISDLTNGTVSDVTGLGSEYKVYIIVRMTNGLTNFKDFSLSTVAANRNVIAVHPEPSY